MALNLNKDIYSAVCLIEMTWANGAIYRYSSAMGDVVWNSFNWQANTDTQGAIQTLPSINEGGEIASNIDIDLTYTATIRDLCLNQHFNQMICKIYQGEIDPNTGALQIETTPTEWICQAYETSGNQSIKLIFGDKITYMMQHSVAWKTNSEHQKLLVGTDVTDLAFDKVSGANSQAVAGQAVNEAVQRQVNAKALGGII